MTFSMTDASSRPASVRGLFFAAEAVGISCRDGAAICARPIIFPLRLCFLDIFDKCEKPC